MVTSYKTKGFIFKKEDRAEADRIFSVFTEDFGRVEIFAKAIRRITSKLKGGVEIFSLSQVEFIQGKNRKTLIDATIVTKFKQVATVPEKIEIAYRVSDLLQTFIKGQEPDKEILNTVLDFFEKLNDYPLSNNHCNLLYYYFFWNFISVLGYGPQLSVCALCQQRLVPDKLYFSYQEGGIACQSCAAKERFAKRINADTVKVLRLILKKDWPTLSKLKVPFSCELLCDEISREYTQYLIQVI